MKYSIFTMLKSALKKSCPADIVDERRVTFCKTVQIYGNSIKPDYVLEKYEEKLNNPSVDIELFSLESMLQAIETFDCNHKDDPNDFFVHKVVYDHDQLNDSSEDIKVTENNEGSPNNSDAENEVFVVHQVNLHEDDVSDELAETESCVPQDEMESKEVVSELSVQNIEQHNKLTETQLLLDCQAVKPVVITSLDDSKIILSPPLQELSVDRLICPQNDKWFWDLDISPLNSVQESDSESNVSSEDTMIMMTTEECVKNEQKIQESLQKFVSLKKQSAVTQDFKLDFTPEYIPSSNEFDLLSSTKCPLNIESKIHSTSSSTEDKFSSAEIVESAVLQTDDYNVNMHHIPSNNNINTEILPADNFSSRLVRVEIPEDVREWKIPVDKRSESSNDNCHRVQMNLNNVFQSTPLDAIKPVEQTENSLNTSEHYADELEHFVDQCTERVERIRKRYSINENMLWTPRRGIRPRFGSSAEILQHISNGNHMLLSSSANVNSNHYSWPYYVSDEQHEKNQLMKPHSTSVLTNFLDGFQCETLPETTCEQKSVEKLQQLIKDTGRNNVHWCLVNGHTNPMPPFHERESPEGASPPRLSSESLCDTESNGHQGSAESIVYYSMQV